MFHKLFLFCFQGTYCTCSALISFLDQRVFCAGYKCSHLQPIFTVRDLSSQDNCDIEMTGAACYFPGQLLAEF